MLRPMSTRQVVAGRARDFIVQNDWRARQAPGWHGPDATAGRHEQLSMCPGPSERAQLTARAGASSARVAQTETSKLMGTSVSVKNAHSHAKASPDPGR